MTKPMQQQGFTLIELMISLVLGLLVVAAATAIFISAQRSMNMQTGMSELQQNSIFGLSQITHDLRHVNLNTSLNHSISTTAKGAGIILGVDNALYTIPADMVTQENVIATKMSIQSDRLTVQYKPNSRDLVNCEGVELNNPDWINIQTYFLLENSSGSYDLRCSAMYGPSGRLDNGVVLLQDVEAFKVRFGVRNYNVQNGELTKNNGLRYKTIDQLSGVPDGGSGVADRIASIEVNIIARSTSSVGSGSGTDAGKTFSIAGLNNVRTTSTEDRFLREAFSQVVALRNAQGSQ